MHLEFKIVLLVLAFSAASAFVAYWQGYNKGREDSRVLARFWRVRAESIERRLHNG